MGGQTYLSLADNAEHLQRHFATSLTVGSKFFAACQDRIITRVEQELRTQFDAAQQNGDILQRVILELDFDDAIGTDALVALQDVDGQPQYPILRDSGTPHEARVIAVLAAEIPLATRLTVIAGPYGDSGTWGIYTMFPGKLAPPFPNAAQPDDQRQANTEFWNSHGFLATAQEIAAQSS